MSKRVCGVRSWVLGLVAAAAVIVSAHQGTPAGPVQISGAGATFPYPIYTTWFTEYLKVRPDVQINYLSVGSSGGVDRLMEFLVFFAATDTPMTGDEYQRAPGPLLHLPTVVGAVVPIYNLPGFRGDLKFDAALLADIYLGKVKNWSDPAVVRVNGDLKLPHTDITVVHRSDSSGTTFIFADFLTKTVPEWKRLVGPRKTFPVQGGVGVVGNEQVAAAVKETAGAIGYVELAYATRNQLDVGLVRNSAGEFVRPTIASIAAAGAASVAAMPRDFRVSITNAPGPGVYPIASFTWILLYEHPRDTDRSRLMVDFMRWALTDGQKFAADLGYAPLPADIVQRELRALDRIKVS